LRRRFAFDQLTDCVLDNVANDVFRRVVNAAGFAHFRLVFNARLLGVYDTLLRYHTAYYNRNKRTQNEGRKAGCLPTETGALRLSLLQKRTILLNNIYGVDIDPQAVEVAQLSLYLKLLEDETIASAHAQQRALHAALLPSLIRTIDAKRAADTARHDRITQLVDQMIEAKKQLAAARSEGDRNFYESKCATLDRQIDVLVYELYDLTPEEIAIVEEAKQ